MKKALITGISGQDGAYLAKLLLDKGYLVYGTSIDTPDKFSNLIELGIKDHVSVFTSESWDYSQICDLLKEVAPNEIYNFAAISSVAFSFKEPLLTAEATGLFVIKVLEAVRMLCPKAKFYQASTGEMFGSTNLEFFDENTSFNPCSPYAISKLFAHLFAKNYREAYGIFACSGILFNHESPLRGPDYVTRKITTGIANIKYGLQDKLYLGNLDVLRDWGYAPDYVEAMWLMMQQEKPDDYVIATGELHSIKEFVEDAFSYVGLDWQDYVVVDEKYFRPIEIKYAAGDASKARKLLGWKPRVTFKELVKIMVDADMKRIKIYYESK